MRTDTWTRNHDTLVPGSANRRWLPGHVSAGRVLEWIDKAGYACAVAWSRSYSVTAYVGNVSFTRPVQVGDIVEAAARIVQTGRSSMNLLVTVRSGTIASTLLNQSTECLLILATTDANGRPTAGSHLDGGNRGGSSAPDGSASAEKECAATLRKRWPLSATPMLGGAPRIVLRFLAAPTDINLGGKVHGGIAMRWIDEAALP